MESQKDVEMPGFEPGAFHMRSERSTTELHPRAYVHLSRAWDTNAKVA